MLQNKLSASNKVVFLHVPKTAGMTFTSILKNQYSDKLVFPAYQAFRLRKDFDKHERKYQLFAGHWDYSDIEKFKKKPIVLTFVRDPIERLASQFFHLKKSPDDAIEKNRIGAWDKRLVELCKAMEFEEFCCFEDPEIERMANLQTRHLAGRISATGPGGEGEQDEILSKALENLGKVEFIGIVEYFNLSMELFFEMFNIDEEKQDYNSINVNKARPRTIDREIFESNLIAKSRVRLDLEVYKTAVQLFHEKLDSHGLSER